MRPTATHGHDFNPALFLARVAVLRDAKLQGIGARLRHERERLGFEQSEIALAMGYLSGGYVDLVERGEKPPTVNLLYWLALAGADISFILADRAHASAVHGVANG